MYEKDQFAIWFSEVTLHAANEDIELLALKDIKASAYEADDLDTALSTTTERRPGDFGVEFIAAALSSFCILIGRQLWESYTKSLSDKVGEELADLTVEKAKTLLKRVWQGDDPAMSLKEIENMVRKAAAKTELETSDVDRLIEVFKSEEMKQAMLSQ
jgi:hypothetical protein